MLGLSQEEIDASQKEWYYRHFTHQDLLMHVLEIILLSRSTQPYDLAEPGGVL